MAAETGKFSDGKKSARFFFHFQPWTCRARATTVPLLLLLLHS